MPWSWITKHVSWDTGIYECTYFINEEFWDTFLTNIVLFITQPTYLCVHACVHMRMISWWHSSAAPPHPSDTTETKRQLCIHIIMDAVWLYVSNDINNHKVYLNSEILITTIKPECHNSGPWMDHCSINTVCIFYSVGPSTCVLVLK